jgi:glycosyltransferase involved in cell wall biosynthesis
MIEWRRDWPVLTDWALTFGPEIEALSPDLVHANDAIMLGAAARATAGLRVHGHRCSWIYDAHEYVPVVDWGGQAVSAAYRQFEREFITRADAVVTVSEEIAALLQREYGLASPPDVVRNVPIREPGDHSEVSVRRAAGVPDEVPLIVYSGYLEPARGLGTVIDALPMMPSVHLALVCSGQGGMLDQLLDEARRLGVERQVHLAGYVPQHSVPRYLSSADLGLVGSLHVPGFEDSLPTKTAEYLHARLPLVVSDVKTLSGFVRRHAVGRVFIAGDSQSLAVAVRGALADTEQIRTNITDDLLEELSWERQSEVLLGTYRAVTGIDPEAPSAPTPWTVAEGPEPPAEDTVG